MIRYRDDAHLRELTGMPPRRPGACCPNLEAVLGQLAAEIAAEDALKAPAYAAPFADPDGAEPDLEAPEQPDDWSGLELLEREDYWHGDEPGCEGTFEPRTWRGEGP